MKARLDNASTLDLQIEALAYAEGEFLHIHPFEDFNGRTIRAVLAELLMRFDLPIVDTSVKRNTARFKKYQNALAEYDNGRIACLVDFWQERLSE
jgi:Fic family protein